MTATAGQLHRRLEALVLHKAGLNFKQIGVELGCSGQRAAQLVRRMEKDIQRGGPIPIGSGHFVYRYRDQTKKLATIWQFENTRGLCLTP